MVAPLHNGPMALKLFRHTDYAESYLSPGEARFALHPAWAIAAASAWIGFACNVALWHALTGDRDQWLPAVATGLMVTGAAGFALSLLGWRRTFKPMATMLLLAAAALAAGLFTRGAGFGALLRGQPALSLVPDWASLFGWQVPTLLLLLGGAPVLWLWARPLRRLDGSTQLGTNVSGMLLALVVAACGLVLNGALPDA